MRDCRSCTAAARMRWLRNRGGAALLRRLRELRGTVSGPRMWGLRAIARRPDCGSCYGCADCRTAPGLRELQDCCAAAQLSGATGLWGLQWTARHC